MIAISPATAAEKAFECGVGFSRLSDEQNTRAFGSEPDVLVDAEEWPAHAGDLLLDWSDGLTSIVREPQFASLLQGDGPLDEMGAS